MGIMALYGQLLTLLMGWTSPLGPVATLFQSGILLLHGEAVSDPFKGQSNSV